MPDLREGRRRIATGERDGLISHLVIGSNPSATTLISNCCAKAAAAS